MLLLTGLVLWFILSITIIILLTARWKVHPFFALLLASLVMGAGAGIPYEGILGIVKEGFGNIMRSLGMVIILGTVLGVLLEKSGSTKVMADCIRKRLGNKRPGLVMSATGFVVGIPIFCDSGFIVLSGLNKMLARQTRTPLIITTVSLATGLYAVHCLIPPHPGAAAAASLLDAGYGQLILHGLIVAVAAAVAGYLYGVYAGRKAPSGFAPEDGEDAPAITALPSAVTAFLPVIVPIGLIAMKAFISQTNLFGRIINILGEPEIALFIGVLFAFGCVKQWNGQKVNEWLSGSIEKAGGILVIIGAGGAFGAILNATQIGRHFSESLPLAGMGLLFPFLLTFVLKTAQGSSTVAIITAASIVQPLLPVLGFITPESRMLCVLAMGSGSMMVSHGNDAYFWVISKFERIAMQPMLRVYSVATLVMGLVSFAVVYLISLLY